MSLGEVIREYRKRKKMTQEEMARQLGVTAPAVNKWENDHSCPDISLLAPIARLLGITLDQLLSFQETLTAEEIRGIICEADRRLKEEPYETVFAWAKEKLEQYPNCAELVLNTAILFDAQRMIQNIPDGERYEEYFCSLYVRALESADEAVRVRAADALVGFYMRKEQYDMAEKYLEYFSIQNPERKRKQAEIYGMTGRVREAYRAYEELVFSDFQRTSMELHGMYLLAQKEKDRERARMLAEKQKELARCFEMGRYQEVACGLEFALSERDKDAFMTAAEELLASVGQIQDFRKSALYEHMEFKELKEEFTEELRENLKKCFRDGEEYAFLKGEARWENLIGER